MELIGNRRAMYSFEIFPPKKDMPMDTIYTTLDGLSDLNPEFISVTCGAGGSGANGERTLKVVSAVKDKYGREGVAHLPCINMTKEEAANLLDDLHKAGINKVLALRGDRVEGVPPKEDFKHASDLIAFIKEKMGDKIKVMAACYPEGHIESVDMDTDLEYMKLKADVGAEHFLSQLFFDNNLFYDFLDHARRKGIDAPIEAGIMPVTSKKQIERMVTLCGATMPKRLQRLLARHSQDPNALREAGIAFAVSQIADLLAMGVDGIHLYTMNNPYIAQKITDAVKGLL